MATLIALNRNLKNDLHRRLVKFFPFECISREHVFRFVTSRRIIKIYPVVLLKVGVKRQSQQAVFGFTLASVLIWVVLGIYCYGVDHFRFLCVIVVVLYMAMTFKKKNIQVWKNSHLGRL